MKGSTRPVQPKSLRGRPFRVALSSWASLADVLRLHRVLPGHLLVALGHVDVFGLVQLHWRLLAVLVLGVLLFRHLTAWMPSVGPSDRLGSTALAANGKLVGVDCHEGVLDVRRYIPMGVEAAMGLTGPEIVRRRPILLPFMRGKLQLEILVRAAEPSQQGGRIKLILGLGLPRRLVLQAHRNRLLEQGVAPELVLFLRAGWQALAGLGAA